jgi:hypothetical protein
MKWTTFLPMSASAWSERIEGREMTFDFNPTNKDQSEAARARLEAGAIALQAFALRYVGRDLMRAATFGIAALLTTLMEQGSQTSEAAERSQKGQAPMQHVGPGTG